MALFPLNVITEILINGVWRDISRYVYQRDTMTITGGRTNNGDTSQPASVNITLNTRDGRFSPNKAAGAFYPYLAQNTQLFIDISTPEGGRTGLRQNSMVQCENLLTYDQRLIVAKIGALPAPLSQQIDDCLKAALDLP